MNDVSVSQASIYPGQVESIHASLSALVDIPNANVEIRVVDSASEMVGYRFFPGVNLTVAVPSSFQYDFVSAPTAASGTYSVVIGVWSSDWLTNYLFGSGVQSFGIQTAEAAPPPAPDPTPAVTAPPPAPPPPAPSPPAGAYPFAGQPLYVTAWSGAAQNIDACPALMPKIASHATAVWLGGEDNATAASETSSFLTQAASQGAMAVFVLYNIPNRDCGSYSAGGTSAAAYPGWIAAIASAIGNTKAAIILEPDALADVADTSCMDQTGINERLGLIRNAVISIKSLAPNTSVYIDAGNPGWVPAATMANLLSSAGIDQANGFSINVAGFFTTDSNVQYGNQISSLTGGKHFVIDTSRNGNGPSSDNQWCNPPGRALGLPPQGFSSGLVDAYLWVKPPGDSDGACNGAPPAGTFMPQYACDLAAAAAW